MTTRNEPALRPEELTPEETGHRTRKVVGQMGAAFGDEASFAETGRRLGLDRWAFCFGARAGVLGPVDADVVTAVCGFFAPGFVRPAWQAALAAAAPATLVSEDVRLCVSWARRQLAGLPGIERLADLAGRVVDAADASSRGLLAAWRAWPDAAERRTDILAGMAYACLDRAERAELVSLLQAAHQRVSG